MTRYLSLLFDAGTRLSPHNTQYTCYCLPFASENMVSHFMRFDTSLLRSKHNAHSWIDAIVFEELRMSWMFAIIGLPFIHKETQFAITYTYMIYIPIYIFDIFTILVAIYREPYQVTIETRLKSSNF